MQNKCNTVYRFEKERLTSERDQIAIMNDNFRKIRAALTSRHQIPLQYLQKTLKIFLTLIGMRWDTFMSLSIMALTLSADFLSNISKLFWRGKLTSIKLS